MKFQAGDNEQEFDGWQNAESDEHRVLFNVQTEVILELDDKGENSIEVRPVLVTWECNHGEVGVFDRTGTIAYSLSYCDIRNKLGVGVAFPLAHAQAIRAIVDKECGKWGPQGGVMR